MAEGGLCSWQSLLCRDASGLSGQIQGLTSTSSALVLIPSVPASPPALCVLGEDRRALAKPVAQIPSKSRV